MTSEDICAFISDIFPFSLFGSFASYVFFAFIFLVFYLVIRLHLSVKKKQSTDLEWEKFATACKRKGFDDNEHFTAAMFVKTSSIKTSPMKFISSSEVFEQVVADVLHMIKTAARSGQKDFIPVLKSIRTKLHFDGRTGDPLKSTREIRSGQQLDIAFPGTNTTIRGVVSTNDDAQLRVMLDRPLDEKRRQGAVKVSFVIDNDARYKFSTDIAGAGSSYIAFDHPAKIFRQQNREHFRCSITVPVRIIQSNVEDEKAFLGTRPDFEDTKIQNLIKAQSTDISGGGMRIAANEELNIGQRLYINFQLGGRQYNIPCEITDKKPGSYARLHYGVQFMGLSNSERESIINHINSRERTALKRRNLED